MSKIKRLYSLSEDAINKLQQLSNDSNISNSSMIEALISLAYDEKIKVEKSIKIEYIVK